MKTELIRKAGTWFLFVGTASAPPPSPPSNSEWNEPNKKQTPSRRGLIPPDYSRRLVWCRLTISGVGTIHKPSCDCGAKLAIRAKTCAL